MLVTSYLQFHDHLFYNKSRIFLSSLNYSTIFGKTLFLQIDLMS